MTNKRQIVYLGQHREYSELEAQMQRFKVSVCVIDAMPDIHATLGFPRFGGQFGYAA